MKPSLVPWRLANCRSSEPCNLGCKSGATSVRIVSFLMSCCKAISTNSSMSFSDSSASIKSTMRPETGIRFVLCRTSEHATPLKNYNSIEPLRFDSPRSTDMYCYCGVWTVDLWFQSPEGALVRAHGPLDGTTSDRGNT